MSITVIATSTCVSTVVRAVLTALLVITLLGDDEPELQLLRVLRGKV